MQVLEASGHWVGRMITLRDQHSLAKAVVPQSGRPHRVLLEVE
jgi:hypothetical protein